MAAPTAGPASLAIPRACTPTCRVAACPRHVPNCSCTHRPKGATDIEGTPACRADRPLPCEIQKKIISIELLPSGQWRLRPSVRPAWLSRACVPQPVVSPLAHATSPTAPVPTGQQERPTLKALHPAVPTAPCCSPPADDKTMAPRPRRHLPLPKRLPHLPLHLPAQ